MLGSAFSESEGVNFVDVPKHFEIEYKVGKIFVHNISSIEGENKLFLFYF